MAKLPFTVEEKHLNTGLRGFPVGTVWTSKVDPQKGVSYVGYPIQELVELSSEEVIYLLLYKKLPSEEEKASFSQELVERSKVSEEVLDLLSALPARAHPMTWLQCGIQYLGIDRCEDYLEDGLNLISRISEVVAAIFRLRAGWGDPIPSKPDLGYVENFVHMLGVPQSHPHLMDVLKAFHILHLDHGGGNLSTFTGKAVASGLADMYTSLSAAMGGLSGPRHGRANQDCLRFVQEIGSPEEGHIRSVIERKLANKELIYGFGHAVLRAEDPRAAVQYELAERYFADDRNVQIVLQLRRIVPSILGKIEKIANPYPNVDAVSGSLLHAAGLRDPEYYTVLFGWSRVVGIVAQIIDERLYFRGGKGVPIYRCLYLAENQPERHLERG